MVHGAAFVLGCGCGCGCGWRVHVELHVEYRVGQNSAKISRFDDFSPDPPFGKFENLNCLDAARNSHPNRLPKRPNPAYYPSLPFDRICLDSSSPLPPPARICPYSARFPPIFASHASTALTGHPARGKKVADTERELCNYCQLVNYQY